MVAGEDFGGDVGDFFHAFVFVHGSFDAEADHLLGELIIAEEEIDEELELSFDLCEDLGVVEELGDAELGLGEQFHQLILGLVHHNICSTGKKLFSALFHHPAMVKSAFFTSNHTILHR